LPFSWRSFSTTSRAGDLKNVDGMNDGRDVTARFSARADAQMRSTNDPAAVCDSSNMRSIITRCYDRVDSSEMRAKW
jgi:hypothetical protein